MAPEKQLLGETAREPTSPERFEIWVADDNADVRLLLSRAFKRCGVEFWVRFFFDGSEVLEEIRTKGEVPRVLLLDVEMPKVNGLQTLKYLKREGHLCGTTVMMFSGVTDSGTVKEAYHLGASLYLSKPVGGDEYRDLAKLCCRCGNLPVRGFNMERREEVLGAGRALEIALSAATKQISLGYAGERLKAE